MWLDKLKELKRMTGMSSNQIADRTKLPKRTIDRIFSGDTESPYVDTVHRIVTAMGGSLDDIFADTKVVVATETLVEVKETADVIEAERDLIQAENDMLKAKVSAYEMELELLKKELQHKEELLAVYKYFIKTGPTE